MRWKHKRINHEIVDERERERAEQQQRYCDDRKMLYFSAACQKEPKSTHNKVRKRSRAKVIAAVFNFEMIKCFTNSSARARLSRASPEFDLFLSLCLSARCNVQLQATKKSAAKFDRVRRVCWHRSLLLSICGPGFLSSVSFAVRECADLDWLIFASRE